MNDYIKDLTARMANGNYDEGEVKIAGQYESHKTVSAKAHNEARRLSDTAYITGLFEDITAERDHNNKRDLYFILKHIAINTKNKEATIFLLERLSAERDKFVLVTMLSGLAEIYKSEELDLTPVLKCAESKNWQIRGKAYEALTNSTYNAEEFLTTRLLTAENSDDIRYLLTALKYVATEKSIAAVEGYLKHKQAAVSNAAAYTLAIILLRAGNPVEEVHEKTAISIDGLNELASRLPLLTRPPLV
jgi:hypothetical protein